MAVIQNIAELPELSEMIGGGFVSERRHPTLPLRILNYTARAQYDHCWNETTLICRGLIVDDDGEIVSRPFRKFFNLEQVESLPDEPFEVFEKVDGSLGITYWHGPTPRMASRGSFDSEQAEVGSRLLEAASPRLDPALTYLFEIIYPKNRIVVDYGPRRDIVLLAAIETATGREVDCGEIGVNRVQRIDGVSSVADLRLLDRKNFEGFVVRFASGFRVKVKLAEYLRLHKLLTGINERTILTDYLLPGNDIRPLLDRVPDEFSEWVRQTTAKFQEQYIELETAIRRDFNRIGTQPSRREFAAHACLSGHASILFKMFDGRPYEELIWRKLKSEANPFRQMTAEEI